MSFLNALENLYFWAYTAAAAGVLALAWLVLFWLQRRGKALDVPWRIYWSWVLLAVTTVTGVLLGHETFALLVALVSVFACKEFARATGLYADWLFTGVVYLAILAVNGVALWAGTLTTEAGVYANYGYDFFMATPIYGVALLCVLPVLRNQAEGMLQRVALAVMAFVYFGYFLAHLSLLAGLPSPRGEGEVYGYVFFLVFGSATTDLAGTVAERWLGGKPMAPGISADKTWTGAAAALTWAFLWSFTLGWTLPQFAENPLAMVLAALVFGIMGLMGDLVMRYILRDLGLQAQEEGRDVVPYLALNHLNRLIFVAPVFFRLVHLFYP
jgi:phosphatidate cytidylyltransferase